MEQNASNVTNRTNGDTPPQSTPTSTTKEYWVLVLMEHSGHRMWVYYSDPTVSDFTIFVLILVLCTALFLVSFWWRAPGVSPRNGSWRPVDPQQMPLIAFPQ